MYFKSIVVAAYTCLAALSFNANATTLEVRLGGLAYYDPVANLTWLADANAAGTTMTWSDANAWAAGLDVAGVTGWRLPTALNSDGSGPCSGYSCTGSEMGNLFYNVLGNTAVSLTNTGPFNNVQSYYYWSATEYAPNPVNAWDFLMGNGGNQYNLNKSGNFYAWAVQSGDVSAVPLPAAAWLFGSGLFGLIGVARKKARS